MSQKPSNYYKGVPNDHDRYRAAAASCNPPLSRFFKMKRGRTLIYRSGVALFVELLCLTPTYLVDFLGYVFDFPVLATCGVVAANLICFYFGQFRYLALVLLSTSVALFPQDGTLFIGLTIALSDCIIGSEIYSSIISYRLNKPNKYSNINL